MIYDVTKLSVYTRWASGWQASRCMTCFSDEYDIQIEFGDICNILAYISIGDRTQDIERLVGALAEYRSACTGKIRQGRTFIRGIHSTESRIRSPQEAFYAAKKVPSAP